MERSLLRLSRAYEKGQLTPETYRRRRAELINAVLSDRPDDETITVADKHKIIIPSGKSTPESDDSEADSRNMLPIYASAGAVVVLVVALALMFGPGDEAPESAGDTGKRETIPVAQIPVLQSFTNEILADMDLTDDEILKLIDLWDASNEDSRGAWNRYADLRLVKAREMQDPELVRLWENLYYELDVSMPDKGMIAAIEASAVEEGEALIEDEAETASEVDAAEEVVEDTVAAVDQQTRPIVQEGTAEEISPPAADETASTVASVEEASAPEPVTEVEDEPVDEEPTRAGVASTSAQEASAPVSAPAEEAEAEAPPQAVASSEPAADIEQEHAELIVEPSEDQIEQQQSELVRSEVDLNTAFAALEEGTTELELLSAFTDAWGLATRDERIAFSITGNAVRFSIVKDRVMDGLAEYSYNKLDFDDRHVKLRRINRILRQLMERSGDRVVGIEATDNKGKLPGDAVMSMDPEKYTLQLLGSGSEQGVIDYIDNHDEVRGLYYVGVVREGEPWFIVLQGEYSSKNVALLVYESFPPTLKERPPWARSFESIQELLVSKK